MTKLIGALGMSAVLVLAPALVLAQDSEWQTEPAPPQAQAPQTPEPQEVPPPPPAEQPSAPQQPQANAQPEGQVTAAVPPGQWVYTQQYGWVWMPYSDAYTSVPPGDSGVPYAYVYYPAWSAWTWVAAPWVWGIGPWPFFGFYGAVSFGWYAHGWWAYPAYYHYPYSPYHGYAPYPRTGGWPRPVGAARPGYVYRGGPGAQRVPTSGFYARGVYPTPRPAAAPFPRAGGFAPHPGGFAAPRFGGAPHAGGVAHGGGGFHGHR
jgi:hypothetical protein